MQKAKNLEHRMGKAITDKESLLQNVEFIDPLTITINGSSRDVTAGAQRQLAMMVRRFSLSQSALNSIWVTVSLIGPNGSGKSSLIAAIFVTSRAPSPVKLNWRKRLLAALFVSTIPITSAL